MIKWLGWILANILIVLLIWQKVQWQNKEEVLQKELNSLQERTLVLEQSIVDLHVKLDEIEEFGLKQHSNHSNESQESFSNRFKSMLGKLKHGAEQLKEKASELNRDLKNKQQKSKTPNVPSDELL